MARTPLADRLAAIAAEAQLSRRQFLGAAGAATVGWTGRARAAAPGRIVAVGAGLAGLTAA